MVTASFTPAATCADLLNEKQQHPLVHVDADSSTADALRTLCDKKISSVVISSAKSWMGAGGSDAHGNDGQGNVVQFIGIVAGIDLMSRIGEGGYIFKAPDGERHLGGVKCLDGRVADLIGSTLEGQSLWVFDDATPVAQVVEPLYKGTHRVLVRGHGSDPANPSTHTYRILTQSDVVRHLYTQDVPAKLATVAALNLIDPNRAIQGRGVVVVDGNQGALQAFQHMHTNQVSAAVVVDSTGVLQATLAASDLRNVESGNIEELMRLPVHRFLAHLYGESFATTTQITCTAADTLQSVMEKVLTNRVHRVWVVDDTNRVTGVVSLTDIIRACLLGNGASQF